MRCETAVLIGDTMAGAAEEEETEEDSFEPVVEDFRAFAVVVDEVPACFAGTLLPNTLERACGQRV